MTDPDYNDLAEGFRTLESMTRSARKLLGTHTPAGLELAHAYIEPLTEYLEELGQKINDAMEEEAP